MARRKRQAPAQSGTVKEYRCLAHGHFEATTPRCPNGCNTVERVFLTPIGIGNVAKNIDRNLQALADDHGLTDLRNDRGSVMESLRRPVADDPYQIRWGSLPTIRSEDASSSNHAVSAVVGGGAETNAAVSGSRSVSVLESVRESARLTSVKPLVQAVDRTPIPQL